MTRKQDCFKTILLFFIARQRRQILPKSPENHRRDRFPSSSCLRPGFHEPLLFISAVAVRAAESKSVLPHKVSRAARLAHGVVQTAQRGSEVIQPQLFHQHTDAAFGEASLVAAVVGVFVKLHIPRVGVAVSGSQRGGGFHTGNVLFGEFALSALAAEPFHRLCHHGFCIILRQPIHIRALRHGENKRTEHCTVDNVHLEPVGLFKLRQVCNDLPVFRFCLFRDRFCRIGIVAEHRCQLFSE